MPPSEATCQYPAGGCGGGAGQDGPSAGVTPGSGSVRTGAGGVPAPVKDTSASYIGRMPQFVYPMVAPCQPATASVACVAVWPATVKRAGPPGPDMPGALDRIGPLSADWSVQGPAGPAGQLAQPMAYAVD